MPGNVFPGPGQSRRERRGLGLALPWLLILVAALGLLSCAALAGKGTDAAPAGSAAVPSLAPSGVALSPLASPTLLPSPSPTLQPSPSPAATQAPRENTVVPLGSPTAPPATSTVDTIAAYCPPAVVPGEVPVYRYRVVAAYPHDPSAFTQGLVYTRSTLYEGTGLYNGLSSLRRVDLETGTVLQIHNLRTDEFGEGIAVHGERILQLTWLNLRGYVYERDSFDVLGTFPYATEGWGLTHDGARFIMSDGTATLHFRDLATLEEIGQVQVHDEHGPVICLNELEYIQGQVYANVWQTDYVAVINPSSGRVMAWIDLAGLLATQGSFPSADVLNGIAYDVKGERLFVTGKLWPRLFEIELVGPSNNALLPLVSR